MQNRLMPSKPNNFGVLLFILLFFSLGAYSQKINLESDLMLIDLVAKQKVSFATKRAYIFKDQPKTFKNSNPLSLAFGGSLYVYQNFFSQHLSASCLYSPSCSDFGKYSVKEFGLIKGTLLSFDRLSRCNRIAATDLNIEDIDKHTHMFPDPIKTYKKHEPE